MKKAILFDLDGTLLPMDEEKFTKYYFSMLCEITAPLGYKPEDLVREIWKGTAAMVRNNGTMTNEEAFWRHFASVFGEDRLKDKPVFDKFYETRFKDARPSCGFNPLAKDAATICKNKGYRVILATNPIFPQAATYERIRWAGMEPDDFEFITTYENSTSCKPNVMYYEEILEKRGLKGEDCIMIGNDTTEDIAAEKTGMDVYIVTDCLINKNKTDLDTVTHGSFTDLLDYLKQLPDVK